MTTANTSNAPSACRLLAKTYADIAIGFAHEFAGSVRYAQQSLHGQGVAVVIKDCEPKIVLDTCLGQVIVTWQDAKAAEPLSTPAIQDLNERWTFENRPPQPTAE